MTARKPITAIDREKYVESIRVNEGRITRRVVKSKFNANDILGADVVSYTPLEIVLDQATDVHHISPRKHTIEGLLGSPPVNHGIAVYVHGIDGYRDGNSVIITRHVQDMWMPDGTWKREERPVDGQVHLS